MKNIIPKFYGIVDNLGNLILNDRPRFKQYLLKCKGEIEIIIKRKSSNRQRSNDQNRYYWGVVLEIISDYMGDSQESAHDAMRLKFLINRDSRIETTKSTTKLNTSEFEEYLAKIRSYMAIEHNIYIPKPNECEY